MTSFSPRYLTARKNGRLSKSIKNARKLLKSCLLCPRKCRTNRTSDDTGICETGNHPVISSFMPHFGEEPPLSGTHGSGTIFFSHCNLRCCFCQNYDISLHGKGQTAVEGQLASVMLRLQRQGCHNINLVTPTHVVPQFLAELEIAIGHGLNLPIVYNSSGYERIQTLKLLDGIIDIYMPDFKFWDSRIAELACNAPDYPAVARTAIKEMHRQVGDLKMDKNGLAQSGLLVRHLVLPDDMAGTEQIMKFLHTHVSPDTHVNVMSQYHPAADAVTIKGFDRTVTVAEYRRARAMAERYGLNLIR